MEHYREQIIYPCIFSTRDLNLIHDSPDTLFSLIRLLTVFYLVLYITDCNKHAQKWYCRNHGKSFAQRGPVAQWLAHETMVLNAMSSVLDERYQFFLCLVAIHEDCARFKISSMSGRTGGRVVTVLARSSRLVAHKHTERTARCGQP